MPGFSAKEQRYLTETLKITDRVGGAFERLSDLTGNFTPSDLADDQWILDVATQLAIMKVSYEDIQKLTPPPSMEYLHSLLVQGLALYAQAADDLATGIDTLDPALIEQAAAEMNQGSGYIQQATAELDRLRQERQG
jgi:hypothetical protein